MSDTTFLISGGFFDAVDSDRLYSADQMNQPYKKLIHDGINREADGTTPGFAVTAGGGMNVLVATGNAMIGGKWAENKAVQTIAVAGNTSGSARIDSIILQCDKSRAVRAVQIVYRQGTTAAPDLVSDDDITELRLANIRVPSAASAIASENITDTRGGAECPWVRSVFDAPDARYIVEEYTGSELAGAYQTVKSAVDSIRYAAQSGQPTVALQASDMIDSNLVYLYQGSETGYSTGYLYYYSDAAGAWIRGAQYGASVVDTALDEDSENPVQNKAIAVAIKTVRSFVVEVPGSAAAFSGSIATGDFSKALATYTAGSGVYAVKDGEVYQLSAASSSTMTFTQMYHGTMNFIKQIQITSADTFTVTNTALSSSAADTSYNNTTSGLTATDVQAAIDENAAAVTNVNGRLGSLEKDVRIVGETEYVSPFSQGQINPINGGSLSSDKYCRTSTYTFTQSGKYLITPKDGYAIILNEYNGIPSGETFSRCLIDNGTEETVLVLSKDLYYRFAVRTVNFDVITPTDVPSDAIGYQLMQGIANKVETLSEEIAQAEENTTALSNETKDSVSAMQELLFNPVYDHLFVNNVGGNNAVIPAESIYHVNISRSLGYKVIECHPQRTSDGHYFVNHLESYAFGRYFESVNGDDISAVKPENVTWQWIVDNVRYKTTIPKYATRPTTLEEFLIGCRVNGLIPLMKFQYTDVAEMAERIMGKGNYIVYEGTRETAGSAVIFRWESYSTVEEILAFCDSIGKPLIYGSSKFIGTFTEEQTKEIVEALHANGYMVCVSYEGNNFWRKHRTYGIDFCGGIRTANRLVTGNYLNIENIFNTNDFTVTGGTVTDNVITLEDGGTVTCANLDSTKKQVAHVDLEVDFDGVLTLTNGLGEFRGNNDFDSADGKLIVCTAVINKTVNFVLTANGHTTIRSIKYKVSLC